MKSTYFLHGLESSGNGTKGQFFRQNFPSIQRPDFSGSLAERLKQLKDLCENDNNLRFIGSSFGGLMATCFAVQFPERVNRLILLAPALNYGDFSPPTMQLDIQTLLIIGKNDDVTPIEPVIPLAEKTFTNLTTIVKDDDHMLHRTFKALDWQKLLML